MAIDAYVGLPGHGKSYGVVEHVIIPSLKEGRHVVTNIPLNQQLLRDDFCADSGGEITQLSIDWHEQADLGEVAPPGAVLVLDEVWRRWPAGEVVSNAKFEDKQLLAEHRHRVDEHERSMRIVLVTQDLAQISSWVRLLVESTYRVSKKSKKMYVVSIYMGAVTGTRPPKSALLRQTGGRFKSTVYKYYSSATQSKTGSVGDESTADGRASILKSIGLWFSGGGAVFLLVVGIIGIKAFFTPATVEPEPKPIPKQEPEVVTVQEFKQAVPEEKPEPKPEKKELPISSMWRVAGFVAAAPGNEGVSRVALVNIGGLMRYVPINECKYYSSKIDVYCDIEGERITPWSGSGAISKVFDRDPEA